jgi:hypothetical protein
MTFVRAIHTIVAGGEHHAPGSILAIDDPVEVERLVRLEAVELVEAEPDALAAAEAEAAALAVAEAEAAALAAAEAEAANFIQGEPADLDAPALDPEPPSVPEPSKKGKK